jgi:hypothetical protein
MTYSQIRTSPPTSGTPSGPRVSSLAQCRIEFLIPVLLRQNQAVADPAFRPQELLARVRNFDLFPQVRHIDAQVLGLFLRVRSPDFPQQVFVRDDLACMLREDFQQGIFCRGQFYLLLVDRDGVAVEINSEMARRENTARPFRWPRVFEPPSAWPVAPPSRMA